MRMIRCMSKRVSLILKDADEAVIAPYLSEGSAEMDAVRSWAKQRGIAVTSEAAALRVLLQAGAEAIQEAVLETGYASLATEFNSPTQNVERRTARARYAERTDARL
jgi:hypothetical protein